MAEITEILKLDIDQALRTVSELGQAIDRALSTVQLRIDPAGADSVKASADQVAKSFNQAEGEARQFERAVERGDQEAKELAASTDRIAVGFDKVRGSVTGLVAGFGAFAAVRGIIRGLDDLVTSFVAFDQAINESLAIVSDVTPEIRAQFEAVARTVSETLRFSAAEAGEAFFFLASAGLSAEQQLAALPQVAEFAQAGMFDLSTATNLLADSQTALGLRAKDPIENLKNLTRVADVLTQANIRSNASVQQFAEALTNDAAAAARLVGVEIEEAVAVLAVFADQGTKGAAAGTAFAIVLRDLQRAALEEPEAFADLGVAVFDAVGEFRPFADIVGELEVALDGMSDAQVRATVTGLGFQDRSVQNLLTLLGTSEAIREYTIDLQAAGGATEELANKQLLSLGARLEIAGNQFENAKISLGESLVPAIEAFVAILPGVIQLVTDLAPALESVAVSFGNAAPAAASAAGEFLRFLEATPRSLAIIGEAGGIVVNTLGAVGASAATLGDAFFGRFGAAAADFDAIGIALENIKNNVRDIQFNRLEQGLQDAIREGRDELEALASTLIELDETEGGTTLASIARLARTAGVDGKNLEAVLSAIVADATRLRLSETQVQQFGIALLDMGRAEGPIRSLAGRIRTELPDAVEVAASRIAAAEEPVTAFFREVEAVIGESGASIAQFILFGGDLTEQLLNSLSPGDRLSVVLGAIGSDAEAAAGAFADSLTPSIRDAQQALIDFNEDGKVSLNEFIRGLEETFTATLEFKTNLATILEVSPNLFAFLEGLPDQTQAALIAAQAVGQGRIEETAAALLGDPEELAAFFQDIVSQAVGIFRSQGPAAVEEFGLGLAELVPDDAMRTALLTEIEAGIEALKADIGFQIERAFAQDDAANRAAGITGDAYDQEIIRRVGLLAEGTDIFDLIEAGLTQVEAAGSSATTTGEAYIADLIETFQANVTAIVDPVLALFDIDLSEVGRESGSTYIVGMQETLAARREALESSIRATVDAAIGRQSPPKLFLDAGKDSGAAFWSGFDQANLTLRQPEVGVTGTATSAASGITGSGIEVNLTTINPTVQDEVADVARMGQIASSIAASYRSVVPNGM